MLNCYTNTFLSMEVHLINIRGIMTGSRTCCKQMVTRWRLTAGRCATAPLLLLALVLLSGQLKTSGQDLSFQKINSGTRGDIHFVYTCPDQSVFFFTDRVYRLENSTWKRIDVPADGKIGCFYPLSSNEFCIPSTN